MISLISCLIYLRYWCFQSTHGRATRDWKKLISDMMNKYRKFHQLCVVCVHIYNNTVIISIIWVFYKSSNKTQPTSYLYHTWFSPPKLNLDSFTFRFNVCDSDGQVVRGKVEKQHPSLNKLKSGLVCCVVYM